TDGARLNDVVPGITLHGDDVGRWLTTQQRDWNQLGNEQQRRLGKLGMKPQKNARARKTPAKTATTSRPDTGGRAFQKGLEALTQYIAREGTTTVPRTHTETLPDGTKHRTGIWIMNQKTRRDRLHPDQLRALAELGIDWAQ
ncbi:helicase associated domain-containing protein, partial [Streptomyces sp. NPDC054883]